MSIGSCHPYSSFLCNKMIRFHRYFVQLFGGGLIQKPLLSEGLVSGVFGAEGYPIPIFERHGQLLREWILYSFA